MTKDTGGPAFPQVDLKDSYGRLVPDRQAGMTLRDYFAAKAMPWVASDLPVCDNFPERVAVVSYAMADAMLKARQA